MYVAFLCIVKILSLYLKNGYEISALRHTKGAKAYLFYLLEN